MFFPLLYICQVKDANKLYYLGADGGHDDDLDRGCLRGLCEREMIKGREFLLISEVSAVSR